MNYVINKAFVPNFFKGILMWKNNAETGFFEFINAPLIIPRNEDADDV